MVEYSYRLVVNILYRFKAPPHFRRLSKIDYREKGDHKQTQRRNGLAFRHFFFLP
jgi:hypothetical protein